MSIANVDKKLSTNQIFYQHIILDRYQQKTTPKYYYINQPMAMY